MKKSSPHSRLRNPEAVEAQILCDLKYFTEGPAIDQNTTLFFTDLLGHQIWCLINQRAEKWVTSSRPNGQRILEDGSHLVCDSDDACIFHYSSEGKKIGMFGHGQIGGLQVRCPNDLCIHPDQGFYFTDSVRYLGAVFYVGWDGRSELVAKNIDYANGIALSSDGQKLYVAESYQNRILCYDMDGPGKCTSEPDIFCNLPDHSNGKMTSNLPDGIAFDLEGRLWVAHYGMQAVQVISSRGQILCCYDTTIPLTSNLCFTESDLIVTGGFDEPGPGRVVKLNVFKL